MDSDTGTRCHKKRAPRRGLKAVSIPRPLFHISPPFSSPRSLHPFLLIFIFLHLHRFLVGGRLEHYLFLRGRVSFLLDSSYFFLSVSVPTCLCLSLLSLLLLLAMLSDQPLISDPLCFIIILPVPCWTSPPFLQLFCLVGVPWTTWLAFPACPSKKEHRNP